MRLGKAFSAGMCVLLLTAALAACGSQQPGPTSTVAPRATAPINKREAARRYFAAMAPVIARDYAIDKQCKAAMAELHTKYGDNGPSQWAWWQDYTSILMRFEPEEQQMLSGYRAIQPPPAFRTAHAALVADNTLALAWLDEVIHDVNTQRAPQQWLPAAIKQLSKGLALDKRVDRQFREAAAKVHVRVPAKLLKTYSS